MTNHKRYKFSTNVKRKLFLSSKISKACLSIFCVLSMVWRTPSSYEYIWVVGRWLVNLELLMAIGASFVLSYNFPRAAIV